MELGQLEAFERAARLGSFTRAADELNLTQPSISARIAMLEQELGGALFERGGKQLRLTPLGKTFLEYAERSLTTLADGIQAVHSYQEGKSGTVNIAAFVEMALYMLPEPMERFQEEFPNVDFAVRLRTQREAMEMLHEGSATFSLVGMPIWDRGVSIHAHFRDAVRPVVSPNHPLAKQQQNTGTLTMNDIYRHTIYHVPLGVHNANIMMEVIKDAHQRSGQAIISVPAVMAVRPLIQGKGIAFLPQTFVAYHISVENLIYLNIEDMPVLYTEPILASLGGRELELPAKAFVQMLRNHWRHILVE